MALLVAQAGPSAQDSFASLSTLGKFLPILREPSQMLFPLTFPMTTQRPFPAPSHHTHGAGHPVPA